MLASINKSQVINILSRYYIVISLGLICIPFDLFFAKVLSVVFNNQNNTNKSILIDFYWFGEYSFDIFRICFALLFFGTIPVLVRSFQSYKTLEITEKISNELFSNIYKNLIHSDDLIINRIGDKKALGIITNHFNAFMNQFITPIVQALSSFLITFSYFILSIIIHPKAALLILSSSILFIILFSISTRKFRNYTSKNLAKFRSIQLGTISSALNEFSVLRYAHVNNQMTKKTLENDSQLRKFIKISLFISQSIKYFIEISIPISFVFVTLAILKSEGNNQLLIALVLILKSLPFIQQTTFCLSTAQLNQKSFTKVKNLIKKTTIKSKYKTSYALSKISKIKFNSTKVPEFNRVFPKFTIETNSINLIIGKSGSGKSTYLKLLSGQIRTIQKNIIEIEKNTGFNSSINFKKFSQLTLYQNQNYSLLPISIYDNLTILNQKSKIKDIKNLMKIFEIYETSNLSNKELLDYCDINNNSFFSGGEIQRLCLVRTFLSEYPIILLDEPTSSLDEATSKKVINAINYLSQNRTIVIASHEKEFCSVAKNIFSIK